MSAQVPEITLSITQLYAQSQPELVQTSLQEAHLLAGWGASDDLQAAALVRGLLCSGQAPVDLEALGLTVGAAWLAQEYQRLLHGPVEPAWCGQPTALERVRCFAAVYRDPEIAFLAVARLWLRMKTGFAGDGRQKRAALDEAREVLAPLLELLGMFALRVDLEEQILAQCVAVGPSQRKAGNADRERYRGNVRYRDAITGAVLEGIKTLVTRIWHEVESAVRLQHQFAMLWQLYELRT